MATFSDPTSPTFDPFGSEGIDEIYYGLQERWQSRANQDPDGELDKIEPFTPPLSKPDAGTDAQSVLWWNVFLGKIERCALWYYDWQHGTPAGQDWHDLWVSPNNSRFTQATLWTAAGINASGYRRVTEWDGTGTPTFEYASRYQEGDIIGYWVYEDIQAVLNALTITQHNVGQEFDLVNQTGDTGSGGTDASQSVAIAEAQSNWQVPPFGSSGEFKSRTLVWAELSGGVPLYHARAQTKMAKMFLPDTGEFPLNDKLNHTSEFFLHPEDTQDVYQAIYDEQGWTDLNGEDIIILADSFASGKRSSEKTDWVGPPSFSSYPPNWYTGTLSPAFASPDGRTMGFESNDFWWRGLLTWEFSHTL